MKMFEDVWRFGSRLFTCLDFVENWELKRKISGDVWIELWIDWYILLWRWKLWRFFETFGSLNLFRDIVSCNIYSRFLLEINDFWLYVWSYLLIECCSFVEWFMRYFNCTSLLINLYWKNIYILINF